MSYLANSTLNQEAAQAVSWRPTFCSHDPSVPRSHEPLLVRIAAKKRAAKQIGSRSLNGSFGYSRRSSWPDGRPAEMLRARSSSPPYGEQSRFDSTRRTWVRRITQNKCSRKTFAFHTESSLIRNEETANEWCRNSPGRADERSPVFVRELLSPRSLPVTDTPYYSRYFEGVPRPATSLGFETRTGGKVVEGPTPPVHDRAALGIVDAAVLDDIRLLISQGLLHVRSRLTLSLEVCVARRPSTSLRGAQNKYQKLLRQIQRSMNSLSVIGDQGNQETIPTHSNCGSKDVKTCTAAQTTQEPEAFSILTYGDVRVAASPRIGAFEIWLTWPVHSVQIFFPTQSAVLHAAMLKSGKWASISATTGSGLVPMAAPISSCAIRLRLINARPICGLAHS